ncbi:M23 family metallopeptidase [Cryobacterium sp. Hh11]|uniref:M23 family metallopeptidase n=1 Tax=Cryobacterium sp. Hh11 TaxID=2555868 RepID=UPI0010695AE5|nr:M23 family metallopeptidase [Cryobacterium sp. Hh11]TFD51951.1 M23 family metallopeptidase [Cryobacterium sp. Hh11]
MASLSLIRPANKEPGRRYGDRPVSGISTIRHLGNDYGWGNGWQIYAAAAGRVSVARWSSTTKTNSRTGGYGNYIIIDHGDAYSTLYAHLPNTEMLVAVGDQVAARQQIGVMGNTGNASGPHLHFEVRLNGLIIDPNPFIGTSTAASSSVPIVLATFPNFGVKMPNRFITRDGVSPWFITDGLTKRLVADSKESQLLVDCGLAVYEEKTNGVNIVGGLVDTIPNA